jgi:dipeptidyl-peptidase 4
LSRPFDSISIEQVARFPRPGMAIPASIRFTPDSRAITYLFSETGTLVRSLWRYDIATGQRSVLAGPSTSSMDESRLSREEELRRERARLREVGVTHYQFAKDATPPVLLVPMDGKLRVRVGDEPFRELEGSEGALDAKLTRDGRRVAFVLDGELFVSDVAGGPPRQLTTGAEDGLTNGVAEFIAQEELDREEGYWWSDDGSRVAFVRADSRHIPKYQIAHQGKDDIDVEEHRYPFAGQANAYVDVGIIDMDSGETRWLDLGPERDTYLARAGWRPDGVFTAQLLSRDQRSLKLFAFDPETGARSLLLERSGDPWLNLDHDTRFLKSGELLRTSEKTGFRHIYLNHPAERIPRVLTDGDWVVTRVVAVDEDRRLAYFIATRESVLERHLYAVSLDGGEPVRLTLEAGWHDVVVAPDFSRFVDTWSTLEHGPRVVLRNMSGTTEVVLFENEEATSDRLGLEPPELFELPAEDGTPLFGAVYRPPSFQPARRYPLVVSVYGGPHAQRVADEWSLTVDLRAQYLARRGFIVLKLDNRGSANRGVAFEAHLARRMGTVEIEDQVAGVRFLVQRGEVDPARVGIYGWSYGGYITCMAMGRRPDVFRVGVAGAPVTHWDGYDTGYTERYMETPRSNPDGYRDGSVMAHVGKLQGKLLLVHGMVDENVHFRHTARLITALSQAQKDYDLLIFPEERHMPREARGLEYQERRVLGYFEQYL